MAIHILKNNIFVLETKNTHYVLGIDDYGYNRHIHWGKKCNINDYYATDIWDENSNHTRLDMAKQEYTVFGGTNYRESDLKVVFPDKCREIELEFVGANAEDNLLTVTLKDKVYPLEIALKYKIQDNDDIITRWAEIKNTGNDTIVLDRAFSAELTLPSQYPYTFKNTNGSWGGEYVETESTLESGALVFDSKRGTSGHNQSPYFIAYQNADENQGDVYFGSLAYSGNFKVLCTRDLFYTTRISLGVNDHDFKYELRGAESFHTPKVFCGYSSQGFGEMSRQMNRFAINHVLPKQFNNKILPVLYNSWEATEFNVNTKDQTKLAKLAAAMGVELFVMDDGWFGARNHDRAGLGDWFVNKKKFPKGLDELIKNVNKLGMDFGLWFEPEMVNPDSDLFRAHPDWAYHYDTRTAHTLRHQLVLNMTREDVQEYIFDRMDTMLTEHNIKYIKWDMNRPLSETGAGNLACPQELWYRHTQAVYDIVDRLKEKHPDVAFESCASGGGRSDYGALLHFDQVWTSDNTSSVDRMMMQKWFTYLRPTKVMRAWVTDVNWYNPPMSLDFRFHVAMQGALGIGGNLTKYSLTDLATARKNVTLYKEIRHLVQFGDLYRVLDPDRDEILFNVYVSEDKNEAVGFLSSVVTRFMQKQIPLKFEGLDDEKIYKLKIGKDKYEKSGAYLKNVGIPVTVRGMGYNEIIKIKSK